MEAREREGILLFGTEQMIVRERTADTDSCLLGCTALWDLMLLACNIICLSKPHAGQQALIIHLNRVVKSVYIFLGYLYEV